MSDDLPAVFTMDGDEHYRDMAKCDDAANTLCGTSPYPCPRCGEANAIHGQSVYGPSIAHRCNACDEVW